MDFKKLLDDDDAVSPVIGVILMVAITVILAAVIATFVLGLGDNLSNTAPQATFSCEGSPPDTTVMTGGDSLDASKISVGGNTWPDAQASGSGNTIVAGDSYTQTGRVIWEDGDQSAILFEGC